MLKKFIVCCNLVWTITAVDIFLNLADTKRRLWWKHYHQWSHMQCLYTNKNLTFQTQIVTVQWWWNCYRKRLFVSAKLKKMSTATFSLCRNARVVHRNVPKMFQKMIKNSYFKKRFQVFFMKIFIISDWTLFIELRANVYFDWNIICCESLSQKRDNQIKKNKRPKKC